MDSYILVFVNVIVLLSFVLWESYFKEKGKNLATKEDIEEITKKIETVKNEIGIHSQQRLQYLNDKKTVLLDFLDSTSILIDYSTRPTSLIYNNLTDKKMISNLLMDLKHQGSKVQMNYWKLYVYFESKIVSENAHGLLNECIDLHNSTQQMLLTIETKGLEYSNQLDFLKSGRNKTASEEISRKMSDINSAISQLVQQYIVESEKKQSSLTTERLRYIVFLENELKIETPMD